MTRDHVLNTLRAHEPELKQGGIVSLAVFGSIARGDDEESSDVDVVVRLTDEAAREGFAYFARIDALRDRLAALLGRPVDIVAEPVSNDALQRVIDAERAVAF